MRAFRYSTACATCGCALPPGSRGVWDSENRRATCENCHITAQSYDRGTPGASATRQWQLRHERHEQRVREKHKLLAPLVLRFGAEPQHAANWRKGAKAEVLIGSNLEDLYADGMGVLHDRRIPGTKYNVDHLVVSSAGVFVINTKHYSGLVEQRKTARGNLRLYVRNYNQTRLLDRIRWQASQVQSVLTDDRWIGVPMIPTLLFIGTDNFPRRQKHPLQFDDVYVLWGKALGKLVRQLGPLNPAEVSELERVLALRLPSA